MFRSGLAVMTAGLALLATQALAAPSPADKSFAVKAAQGGMSEVQEGQLAAQRASSPQVKQFGQRMVQDHGQGNQDLQQIAQQGNLELPTQPSASQHASAAKLSGLSGPAFDKAYIQHEVQDHRTDIVEFRREAQSGKDPALKAYAQKQLPILQQHLQMAESLNTQH